MRGEHRNFAEIIFVILSEAKNLQGFGNLKRYFTEPALEQNEGFSMTCFYKFGVVPMRDCIFLLADKNMEATFTGFLTREGFHYSLGIRQINFDPQQDIIVDESGNDPGVYTRAHGFLRAYQRTHRYAIVVLDNAWNGSPGVEKIHNDIKANLVETGWDEERCTVIVIDPELEVWILQDNPNVEQAFRFKQNISLRKWLEQKGLWDASALKPADPKKAVEDALKATKTPPSSAIYKNITSKVSIKGCVDPAFQTLCSTMQQWFPHDGGQV